MRLQHLELLLALAETGSLRAAADRMAVSQPALTKALRQLEEELGAQLVVRSPKGARLAAAGELLAARAAVALRELARGREEVAWHTERVHASIGLGVSPAAAARLVPGALGRFAARWPQVHVRLVDTLYPRAFTQLRAGEIDVAIGPLPADGPGRDLLTQPLFSSTLVVVARHGHPLQGARQLADLSSARWLLTGPAGGPGDPAHLGLWSAGEAGHATPIICESFSTLLALLREMDVLAVMPDGFFDYYGRRMGLVKLPIRDALPVSQVFAMWRSDAPLTLPAQRLLDALIQESQGLGSRSA